MRTRSIRSHRPGVPPPSGRRCEQSLWKAALAISIGITSCLPFTAARAEFIASYQPSPGPYTTFALELIDYLKDVAPKSFELENLETQGSVENIQSIYGDPEVILAICQEDVAHFFYTGANNDFFFVDRSGDDRLTSLGRIALEEIYLVARPDIASVGGIDRIFVGEPRSGTYATYSSLRRYLRPHWEEVQQGDRFELFRRGEIDAFLDIASTPHPELLSLGQSGVDVQVLPIGRTDLSLGLDVYQATTVPDSLSPSGESFRTVSVPAVLLARRDLPHEIASSILRIFYDETVRERWFPESRRYLEALPTDLRASDRTPLTTDPRFADLPIPPHPSVVRLTLGGSPYLSFAITLSLAVLAWVVWWTLPRYNRRLRRDLLGNEQHRLLTRDIHVSFGAVTWVFICAWAIKYLEIQELLSGRTLTGSGLVHMSAGDLIRWLIVFCTTGYEDTVFPTSTLAKFAAVTVQIVGIALLTWVGARVITFLVSKVLEKRDMQNLSQLTGHVLVCNWNIHGVRLLEELRNPELPAAKLDRTIVVVAADPESEVPTDDFEDVLHVRSEPWDRGTLNKVSPLRADSIIILSPRICGTDADACDGLVYRTALSIRTYLEETAPDAQPPHIVAQVSRPIDPVASVSLGLDEVIASHELGGRLLAQTVTCPGITHFFDEILSCDDESNEVYSCAMPRPLTEGSARFWRVVEYYAGIAREGDPVLPIGLRIAPREGFDARPEGQRESRAAVLLNPTVDELAELGVTTFESGDEVLFLADQPSAAKARTAKGS